MSKLLFDALPWGTIYRNGVILHFISAGLWVPLTVGWNLTSNTSGPSLASAEFTFYSLLVMGVTWPISYTGLGLGYLVGLLSEDKPRETPTNTGWPCFHKLGPSPPIDCSSSDGDDCSLISGGDDGDDDFEDNWGNPINSWDKFHEMDENETFRY